MARTAAPPPLVQPEIYDEADMLEERGVFLTFVMAMIDFWRSASRKQVTWQGVLERCHLYVVTHREKVELCRWYAGRWKAWLSFTGRAINLVAHRGMTYNEGTQKLNGSWQALTAEERRYKNVKLIYYTLIHEYLTAKNRYRDGSPRSPTLQPALPQLPANDNNPPDITAYQQVLRAPQLQLALMERILPTLQHIAASPILTNNGKHFAGDLFSKDAVLCACYEAANEEVKKMTLVAALVEKHGRQNVVAMVRDAEAWFVRCRL